MDDRISYIHFLKEIHEQLSPQYYLEIGSEYGKSLAIADCDSIAIDPKFKFDSNPTSNRTKTLLFQQTSDSFFKKEDLSKYFPHIDIAFLDGFHLFEFVLRDLINIEKHLKNNSIVFIHDCIPLNREMALRSPSIAKERNKDNPEYRNWWTGDVWKIFYVLKDYRPELQLLAVDCAPTGLLVATNFNPMSTVLAENYFEIINKYINLDKNPDWHKKLFKDLNIKSPTEICQTPEIHKHFWL